MISVIRKLRLQYLKLCLWLTPAKAKFERFGVAASVSNEVPNRQDFGELGWVCNLANGYATSRGESVGSDGTFYPGCSFNFIDEPKPTSHSGADHLAHEVLRIGWDKRNPQIHYQAGTVVSLSMNFTYQNN